jgi:hypothetical protein
MLERRYSMVSSGDRQVRTQRSEKAGAGGFSSGSEEESDQERGAGRSRVRRQSGAYLP